MPIECELLGESVMMTEDQVRETRIPTLLAFLDDEYVTEVTIRCRAHAYQPCIYRKTEPVIDNKACKMYAQGTLSNLFAQRCDACQGTKEKPVWDYAHENIAYVPCEHCKETQGKTSSWEDAMAAAAKLVTETISCNCEGFCECYGKSTLEDLAERIAALR